MAQWRQGGKERVSETDSEEKKDEEDEDGEGRGGLPSPGKALMKSPLKFAVIEQHPCPLQKGDQHLSEDEPSFPLPSRFPAFPLDFLPFVSVNSM